MSQVDIQLAMSIRRITASLEPGVRSVDLEVYHACKELTEAIVEKYDGTPGFDGEAFTNLALRGRQASDDRR